MERDSALFAGRQYLGMSLAQCYTSFLCYFRVFLEPQDCRVPLVPQEILV